MLGHVPDIAGYSGPIGTDDDPTILEKEFYVYLHVIPGTVARGAIRKEIHAPLPVKATIRDTKVVNPQWATRSNSPLGICGMADNLTALLARTLERLREPCFQELTELGRRFELRMTSSSLKADVNALERLQIVRGTELFAVSPSGDIGVRVTRRVRCCTKSVKSAWSGAPYPTTVLTSSDRDVFAIAPLRFASH
jgi:hypothetical protein